MAAPDIGRRRLRPPPPWAKIDSSNPLSEKLVACHLPAGRLGAIDLTGLTPLPVIGNPAHGLTKYGRGATTSAAATGYRATTGTSGATSIQPPLTILYVGQYNGGADADSLIYGGNATSAASSPFFTYGITPNNGAGNWGLYGNNANAFDEVDFGTAAPSSSGSIIVAALGTASQRVWENGVAGTLRTAAWTSITYSSTTQFGFGQGSLSGNASFVSVFGAVWSRLLSDVEIIQLSRDPYSFLRY